VRTKKHEIRQKALEIIKSNNNGIRYSELIKKIKNELPHIKINTIHGTIWNLDAQLPDDVYKPAKGLFRHVSFRDKDVYKAKEICTIKEEDFYLSFAKWLVTDLEECTKAIPLGGNRFKDKWGTPDVIGIREPRKSDIIKPATEIISAEIKTDTGNLITAFGQACSYRLFSHKAYIVVPKESPEEDLARIDSLCMIYGIGLILFDKYNSKSPQYEIRVRASKHEPDMFYVNKYLKIVEDDLF